MIVETPGLQLPRSRRWTALWGQLNSQEHQEVKETPCQSWLCHSQL